MMAFMEFKDIDRTPLHTRIQDPGTAILQVGVRDIDATVKALKAAGVTVISKNGEPVLNGTSKLLHGARSEQFVPGAVSARAPGRNSTLARENKNDCKPTFCRNSIVLHQRPVGERRKPETRPHHQSRDRR